MSQGVMQSLIKISANFASENMYRDMYKGMAAAQKVGQEMGRSYEKGFNGGLRQPIGSVGNITAYQHKLLQKSVQKRLANNLQELDNIIDKTILQSLGSSKQNRTNASLSKLAQITALNNYSMKEFIASPGAMRKTMGSTAALDVLRVLDKETFTGYDSIVSNSVKEMREINRVVVQDKVKGSFKTSKGYKPSIATVGGINAGNPLLNRSAGYALGGFFGSPVGMGLSMGALGAYTAGQGIQGLANFDNMFRQTAAYMGGDDPLKAFNDLLREPLENAAYQYATSIEELNSYVMEAIKSGFDPKNIASSLDSVAGLKRAYALSVPAITELIVMASNNDWIDPSDGDSINKYLAKLVTMVRNTKGSLGDFSSTLGYAQPILNAPGMTDTDYMTLMGVVSDSNVKGTRAGRAMGHFFQRLFVPDSSSDAIDKMIISSLQKDGYTVDSKDMKKLSDYFASIGWSIYDKKGQIQIGEGKRYKNYVDAISNLMEKIEKSDFTDAMSKGMGGEFGQIAQRVFEYLLANYPDLRTLRTQIETSEMNSEEIIQTVLEMSNTGLGKARDQFNASLERIALQALKLEESFGALEASLEGLIWFFEQISNGMGAVGKFKDNIDNENKYTKQVLAVQSVAKDHNIDLTKPITKKQEDLLLGLSQEKITEEIRKKQIDPFYSDRDLRTHGLGASLIKGQGGLTAMDLVEKWGEQYPQNFGGSIDYVRDIDRQHKAINSSIIGTNTIMPIQDYSQFMGTNNNFSNLYSPHSAKAQELEITITNTSDHPVKGQIAKNNPQTNPTNTLLREP